MSTEYIKGIIVSEDGVFLHSKSSNDDLPYRTWRCESLSEVCRAEGRRGLDREIMGMLCEYAQLRGSHYSLSRYAAVLKSHEARELVRAYRERIETRPEADRKRLYQALGDLCAERHKRDEPVR